MYVFREAKLYVVYFRYTQKVISKTGKLFSVVDRLGHNIFTEHFEPPLKYDLL